MEYWIVVWQFGEICKYDIGKFETYKQKKYKKKSNNNEFLKVFLKVSTFYTKLWSG